MEFECVEFRDPAFSALLLPIVKEMIDRSGMEMTPEDYVRQIAHSLFTGNPPIKVYTAVEKESGDIAAFAVVSVGGIPPRLWIEAFCQAKKYAKYRPIKKLYEKMMTDMKEGGVKEVYCTTRKPSLARMFVRKGGFKPKEITLVKSLGG